MGNEFAAQSGSQSRAEVREVKRKSPKAKAKGPKVKREERGGKLHPTILAALDLTRKGIPVFPCKLDKSPYVARGFYAATRKRKQIIAWWTQWPDALIGVPTGKKSKIDVLDVDAIEAIANLPAIPLTRRHRTRRGGYHYLFEVGGLATRQKVWPDVDTRGQGGYVVWWPAHGGAIEGPDALAPLPQWLRDVAPAKAPRRKKPVAPSTLLPITWAAVQRDIKKALPTMDPDCGYEEWYRIGCAIYHECNGDKSGLLLWDEWSAKGTKYKAGECERKWISFKTDRTDKITWASIEKPKAPPPNGTDVLQHVYVASSLYQRELPEAACVLDGALRLTPGAWILAGKPKDGKSWLALNLSVAVVSGRAYVGSKPATPAGALYVNIDDPSDRRLKHRLQAMGAKEEELGRLLVITGIPDNFKSGLEFVRFVLQQYPQIKLIVLDTLGSFRSGNRTEAVYQQEYDEMREINAIAREHDVCVLIVHHLRKGTVDPEHPFESISGTLGLQGGVDGLIVLMRKDYKSDFDRAEDEKLGVIWARGRELDNDIALGCRLAEGQWHVIGRPSDVLESATNKEILRIMRSMPDKLWIAKDVHAEMEGAHKLDTVRKAMQRMGRGGTLVALRGPAGGYKIK